MIAITPPKIFSKEVAQNRPPHLPRQQPPSHQNYFHPNFQGWGPNENLKLKSPPYRGSAARLNEVGLAARAAPRLRTRPGAGITRETPTCSFPNAVGPISPIGFHRLIQRVGEAAKMPFPIHPHMLRHACGFKLANDGHDTRALQHYLGHKNIQHTVRYTDMAPDRFKDFWRG